MNLRIVVSCVTFEVAKVISPIKHYRADKAILLHWGEREPYTRFISEIVRLLKRAGIEYEKRDINIMEFPIVMREVRSIIVGAKGRGDHVYVNIGAGPQVFSSAAMVACMMEGGIPFNAPTEEFTVGYGQFFENEKPVGIARKVRDPREIPVFRMDPPDGDLVRGLAIFKDITERYRVRPTRHVMEALKEAGMLDDIYLEGARKKISQGALMRFRRNFLEKWERENWIVCDGRGKFSLTDQGRMMLQIFG